MYTLSTVVMHVDVDAIALCWRDCVFKLCCTVGEVKCDAVT